MTTPIDTLTPAQKRRRADLLLRLAKTWQNDEYFEGTSENRSEADELDDDEGFFLGSASLSEALDLSASVALSEAAALGIDIETPGYEDHNVPGWDSEPVWKTRDGRFIVISQMTQGHLHNALRMIERDYFDEAVGGPIPAWRERYFILTKEWYRRRARIQAIHHKPVSRKRIREMLDAGDLGRRLETLLDGTGWVVKEIQIS